MRWLYGALIAVAVLAAAVLAGAGWLAGTEAGLRWAASKVPGLETDGLRGRLSGEIAADAVSYKGVQAKDVRLRAHLAALLGGRLAIDPFYAAEVAIELRPSDRMGGKLQLPLELDIGNARIDTLRVGEQRIEELKIAHARIGREISAAGSLYFPHERFATRAKVELRGTLERIDAHVVADVDGIAAEARGVIVPDSAQRLQSIDARAGPIDLARFGAPSTALQAELKGTLAAGGALEGTLTLHNSLSGPIDAGRLPFTRLDTRFLTDFTSARLDATRVELAGGGAVQGEASLRPGAVAAKLAASSINLRALHSSLRQTALSGPLQVVIEGERQWARGSLTQQGLGFTAQAVRTGDEVRIEELSVIAESGRVSGTGSLRLTDATPFSANLDVSSFNPAALGDYPAGSLSGAVIAKGRLKPRQIDVKWSLADSVLYGHTFASDGSAHIGEGHISQAEGDVRLGANRLTAKGGYGRLGDQIAVTLEAPRLEEFTALAGSLRARGTLSGSLSNPRAALTAEAEALTLPGGVELQKVALKLDGTLRAHDAKVSAKAPEYALDVQAEMRGGWSSARGWVGQLRALRNAGAYPLELAAPAPLAVAPGRVELGRFEARLAEGRILVREASWTPQRFASSGEFARLPAQWAILAGGLAERLHATMLVDGEWQVERAPELAGFVRLRRAAGDVALVGDQAMSFGIEKAVLEVRMQNGRATGSGEVVTGIARVLAQGEVLPALALQGKVEFADLGTLTRPFLQAARMDGRLSAELRASGTLASPRIHGTLSGEALALELPLYGVQLKEGTLKAVLEGDTLRLESLTARGTQGRLSASGVLPLRLEGVARIAWRADKLALLDRPDLRLVASGEGEASYDGKRVLLTGDLRADRGHFELARERLPSLGDDVVVLGRPAPAKKTRLTLPVTLDLRLDLGDSLVVQAYGYDGKVAGLVDLATSKEGELRAFGRLHAVNGTFLAYGQRLDVDPGVLIFDGPIDNPTLQITAWRRNQAVEAGVQLTGTARAPSVNLVSQPPVPEGERLSWLVLGRPPSGATQADLGLLQAAAGALLAGGDSVPLDRRIARRFGLDELTLRGSGELTGQVVAVGKRISDRLYISYEQGIGAVATNLVKLDYALGRRWTLRAETGSSSGGGLFYRYSWD